MLYHRSLTSIVAEKACAVHYKSPLGTDNPVSKQCYLSSEKQKPIMNHGVWTLGPKHMHKTEIP